MLIGNEFNDAEVKAVLDVLEKNGVFYEAVSEKLGTVMGLDGTQIEVNETLITTYPVLYDSFYVVGGVAENQEGFDMKVMEFVNMAYKFYKPIGVATTGQSYIPSYGNLAGVISAADNSNFGDEFLAAVTQQRFWDRTLTSKQEAYATT